MAKSLRKRILWFHMISLVTVSAILGGSFYFALQRSRFREVDVEMEGAGQSIIALLRALPPFELRAEEEGVPPEVLMRRRERQRRGGQEMQGPRDGNRPDGSRPEGLRPEGPYPPRLDGPPGRPSDGELPPRGPERILRSIELPATFVERHRRREGSEPYFAVLRGDGSLFASSSNAPSKPIPPPAPPVPLPSMNFLNRIPVKQEGHWREMWLTGPENSRVIIGRSTIAESSELRNWLWGITGLTIAIVFLGWVITRWLSKRVLRSLEQIGTEAKKMTPDSLSHRIDVREVDQEMIELVDALNETYSQLGQALERQRQFTGDASHELRTPLSVILGNLELALLDERLDSQQRDSLEAAQRAARRMKNLMEHLLTLARADAGKLVQANEDCDMANLVADCLELCRQQAEEKQVSWDCNLEESQVCGDVKLLTQVVMNLLSNAIKYNKHGGKIHVSVHPDGEMIELRVRDTGIGIPKDSLPHIFERFYQVEDSRSQSSKSGEFQRSHGLGLAITQCIVLGHGGTISVDSQLDQGTEFVVRLPKLKSTGA